MLTINQEKEIRRQKHLAKPSRQNLLEALAANVRLFRNLQKDLSTGGQTKRKETIAKIDAALDELKIP